MRAIATIQYPGKKFAEMEIPNSCVLHGYTGSIKFAVSNKTDGMRSLDVFKNNVKHQMLELGYITEEAELIAIEIFPSEKESK